MIAFELKTTHDSACVDISQLHHKARSASLIELKKKISHILINGSIFRVYFLLQCVLFLFHYTVGHTHLFHCGETGLSSAHSVIIVHMCRLHMCILCMHMLLHITHSM